MNVSKKTAAKTSSKLTEKKAHLAVSKWAFLFWLLVLAGALARSVFFVGFQGFKNQFSYRWFSNFLACFSMVYKK
jgi:hypothetical protein